MIVRFDFCPCEQTVFIEPADSRVDPAARPRPARHLLKLSAATANQRAAVTTANQRAATANQRAAAP